MTSAAAVNLITSKVKGPVNSRPILPAIQAELHSTINMAPSACGPKGAGRVTANVFMAGSHRRVAAVLDFPNSYALLYAMAVIFCRDSMSAQTIICNEVHE